MTEEESLAQQKCFELLKTGDYLGAHTTMVEFERKRMPPRGQKIDWNRSDWSEDLATLDSIFYSHPKILRDLAVDEWPALRVASAMFCLWGEERSYRWFPEGFKGLSKFRKETAARMLLFHAQHLVQTEKYRTSDVFVGLEYLASSDACPSCASIAGKRYDFDNAPELPHEHCTHAMGCRCEALPVVADG